MNSFDQSDGVTATVVWVCANRTDEAELDPKLSQCTSVRVRITASSHGESAAAALLTANLLERATFRLKGRSLLCLNFFGG